LKAVAREALSSVPYPRRGANNGHRLARLAEVCLDGPDAEDCARLVCDALAAAIHGGAVYAFDYSTLLTCLASKQPNVFLDVFLDSRLKGGNRLARIFETDFHRRGNPLDEIPDKTLIAWCEVDPEARYPLVASAIQPFGMLEDSNAVVWNPIVHTIFERAPILGAVLEELGDCVRPRGGWGGSLADILESRLVLFESLFGSDNDEVAAWARNRHAATRKWIAYERESEGRRNKAAFESFE
jgi:hypothetical protein